MRKNTIMMMCGGNKGCLTPNEHPPLIGHYSPGETVRQSPRSRRDFRVPHRVPRSDASQGSADTGADKIPFFVKKRGSRSHPSNQEGLFSNTNISMATPMLGLGSASDAPERGLTPDPPQTTYQRDYEIWKANKGEVSSKPTDDRTSQRDDKTQSSHRSDVMGPQSLESGSMRSFKSGQSALSGSTAGGGKTPGGSPLTARALAHLEAVEEERERNDHGGLVFGSPRGKAVREEPTTNPQTGKSVRPKHEHLYVPLQQQLKRLIPDFTPVTSAPASDRSHYVEAKTRAAEYAEARANAFKSESGSVTARAWCGQKNAQHKDVRVRLVTTKMMRARPIGSEAKTGEECLNDIDDARRQRAAPTLPERFAKGAAKTLAIVPFSTEAAAAAAEKGAAAAAALEVRSEKLQVRRLGQRDFSSVLKAGWEGEEHVDRHQKSRSPSQGGANYDTQMILSPGLLKSRLDVAHERQRRREVRAHTPRVSPCAKAFTSIQTMSMQGYDYRVVNGMVPKDGAIWRYTPPPKPYTPPTPLRLVTSPRSSKSNVTTPRNPASIHNIPRIKVGS